MLLFPETDDIGAAIKAYVAAHHDWLPAIIIGAFTFTNAIRIVAYLPQLLKAASDGNGAAAVSTLTWGLFLVSHLMTVAYALICLGDLTLAMIFVGNAAACCAIVLVTLVKRRRHRKREVTRLPVRADL